METARLWLVLDLGSEGSNKLTRHLMVVVHEDEVIVHLVRNLCEGGLSYKEKLEEEINNIVSALACRDVLLEIISARPGGTELLEDKVSLLSKLGLSPNCLVAQNLEILGELQHRLSSRGIRCCVSKI